MWGDALRSSEAETGKLLKHKIDFMLIGGYAVIFYGYARTTIGFLNNYCQIWHPLKFK